MEPARTKPRGSGRWRIDYNVSFGRNHQQSGLLPQGGQTTLTNRLSNVGWTIDRTLSDVFPRFTQTAGLDVTNGANYRPIANGLLKTSSEQPQTLPQARGNVRYTVPTAVPAHLKAGLSWRAQKVSLANYSRRWSYLGTTGLAADPNARPYNNIKTALKLPRWQTSDFFGGGSAGIFPANPALWLEDGYFFESNKYSGTRSLSEEVTAAKAERGQALGFGVIEIGGTGSATVFQAISTTTLLELVAPSARQWPCAIGESPSGTFPLTANAGNTLSAGRPLMDRES